MGLRLRLALFFVMLSSLSSCLPALRAQHYFLVTAYLRQGRWEKALEVMKRIPDLPPALRLQKGICLAELSRGDEALEIFRALARDEANSPFGKQARGKIVEVLERSEDYPALVVFLRENLARKDDGPWRRLLARALARLGRVDEAIGALAWTLREDEVALLVEILRARKEVDAFFKGRLGEVGEAAPPESLRHVALLACRLEKWKDAATVLRALMKQGRAEAADLDRLADVLGRLGDGPGVVEVLERRLATAKAGKGALLERLGRACMAVGRSEAARDYLSRLVTQGETPEEGYRWAARALVELGFAETAQKLLLAGRRLLKRKEVFSLELARLAERRKDWESFVSELLLGAVVGEERRATAVERLLAVAEGRKDRRESLLAILRTCIAQYPSIEAYWFVLHGLLVGTRADADALSRLIDDMVEALAPDVEQMKDWASSFEVEGRSFEASLLLERAYRKSPPMVRGEILLRLAASLHRQGLAARALETLDRALGTVLTPRQQEEALEAKGRVLLESLQAPGRAEVLFRRLLKERPDSSRRESWQLDLATALARGGKIAEAETFLAEASPKDETLRGRFRFLQARLALLSGRLAEGRKRLASLAEDLPASPEANDALREGLVLASQTALQKTSDADILRWLRLREDLLCGRGDAFEAKMAAWPPSEVPAGLAPEMLDLEARNGARKKQWAQAAASLKKLVTAHPDWHGASEAWLRLAEIQERDLKDPAAAMASLSAFLIACPYSTRLEEIRLRMETLQRALPSN